MIKKAMPMMWGQMASGILFRHKGHVLLQRRSEEVADPGKLGIPGGALSGTEGWYDSDKVERPEINDDVLISLLHSALKETYEETGPVPNLNNSQITHMVNWVGNWPYVTFIVDLTDEQAKLINENMYESTWETEGHEWYQESERPDNLHPGVRHTLDQMTSKVDVSKVVLSGDSPKCITIARNRWTQNQVYDDGKKVYDIDMLKDAVESNRVELINVSSLIDQLYDKEVWAEGDRELSPMMVLTNPTRDHLTIKHMSRIRTSNPQNPIIIRFSNGKIVDGYHRLTKAFVRGDKTIRARFAQEEQMGKAIFRDHDK